MSLINLSNVEFISDDHVRYENGRVVSGHNKNCWRGIKIQTNISGEGYTVTIYNIDGNHPVWNNNIQMAPKQMKIIEQNNSRIILRGYGTDQMGTSFADYGLSLYLNNTSIEQITLHMYDRNIDIVYLKAGSSNTQTELTPKQEIIMALFAKETIDKVKEQFKSGKRIISTECLDVSYRLFKPTDNNINFELLVQIPIEKGEEQNLPGIGVRRMDKVALVHKPIAYFTQSNSNSNSLEIVILNEFEADLDTLRTAGIIPTDIKVNRLTLIANALIAAFSKEALVEADKHKDTSFTSNGLNCDLYLTWDREYPQFFLNDKYGLGGPIAAYIKKSVHPMKQYQELFDALYSMALFTGLNSPD